MSDRRKRRILPTTVTVYREYAPGIKTAFERYASSSACALELCDNTAVIIDGESAHFPLKSIQGSVNDICEIVDEIEHELNLRCKVRLDNTPSSHGICLMISVPLFGEQPYDAAWAFPDEERARSRKSSMISRTQVLIIFLAIMLGMGLHARFFPQY